jgi:hypothetical protein
MKLASIFKEPGNTKTSKYLTEDLKDIKRNQIGNSQPEANKNNPVFEKLSSEGDSSFYNYLDLMGLAKDQNLIILPQSHHYYYDADDLKEVNTVVNLKLLNHVKQIKEFLHTINHILSNRSYFIGIFFDSKNQNGFFSKSRQSQITGKVDAVENGISSTNPILNLMYNFMDSKTNRSLTKKNVTLLLEDAGLKVMDMTEFNGLTFFCAQRAKPHLEQL